MSAVHFSAEFVELTARVQRDRDMQYGRVYLRTERRLSAREMKSARKAEHRNARRIER